VGTMATDSAQEAEDAEAAEAEAETEGTVTQLARELVRLSRGTQAMRSHLISRGRELVEWSTYVLLFHLINEGPQRSSALAEVVHVDPSTVSRQVAQLVKLGLAERRADPDDGRACLLVASAEGERIWASMHQRRNRSIGKVVAGWPPEDVRRLTELLGRFNDGFAAHRSDILGALAADDSHRRAPVLETS
jgi:DNA-binding MarR family transcriptional regulator